MKKEKTIVDLLARTEKMGGKPSSSSMAENPDSESQPPHPPFHKSIFEDKAPVKYIRKKGRNPKSTQLSKIEEVGHGIDADEKEEKKGKSGDQSPQSRGKAKMNRKRGLKSDDSSSSREILNRGSEDLDSPQQKEVVKETKALRHGHGMTLNSTHTSTPLPEQKLLVCILDKLQKEDTYGAFSKPVDTNELPDYYKVIKQAMDFETIRRKLDGGADYKYLEDLEGDVFLLCSNAMLYNSPDTIYHRQARTIQELAKQAFGRFKCGDYQVEPQAKVVRRGRPSNKNKTSSPLEPSPSDHVAPEHSPEAAPSTSGNDRATRSSLYNLRKRPGLSRFHSQDISVTPETRSTPGRDENCSHVTGHDWNTEFPESILKEDVRRRRKNITIDETKRDTYTLYDPKSSSSNQAQFRQELKQLVPEDGSFDYAKSLLKFAADLGPVAQKVALRKMQSLFPYGVPDNFESVGETGIAIQPSNVINTNMIRTPATCASYGEMINAGRKPSNQNEEAAADYEHPRKTPFPPVQQMPPHQQRNPFGGGMIADTASVAMPGLSMGQGLPQLPPQIAQSRYQNVFPSIHVPDKSNCARPDQVGVHEGRSTHLTIRIPATSPNPSSIQVDPSSQQPDLALQL